MRLFCIQLPEIVVIFSIMITCAHPQCFGTSDKKGNTLESTATSVSRLLNGYAQFALELYKNVIETNNDQTSNIFISPVSVWSALMATYLGARNRTEFEIGNALKIQEMSKTSVAKAYNFFKMWYYLRANNEHAKYTFRMSNKLFLQEGLEVRECMKEYLTSELNELNFAVDPEKARRIINKWVEDETNGKIEELLPSGLVDGNTRMVLVNAAYFKGDWKIKFDPSDTEEDDFYTKPNGPPMAVKMMHVQDTFRYAKSSSLNCEMIELPYSGNELSMYILLPTKTNTVDNLRAQITVKFFDSLIVEMKPLQIALSLPKFDIDQAMELKDNLINMKIRDLFNPLLSDLTGFTNSPGMTVGTVRHKAYVEVSEEGTEAAAATGVIGFREFSSATIFNANRPFIFVIRDNVLDMVLFMGLLRKPDD